MTGHRLHKSKRRKTLNLVNCLQKNLLILKLSQRSNLSKWALETLISRKTKISYLNHHLQNLTFSFWWTITFMMSWRRYKMIWAKCRWIIRSKILKLNLKEKLLSKRSLRCLCTILHFNMIVNFTIYSFKIKIFWRKLRRLLIKGITGSIRFTEFRSTMTRIPVKWKLWGMVQD